MTGKRIWFKRQRFEIIEWNTTAGTATVEPHDQELVDLLRNVMVANMPLLYYHQSDMFCVIHPNLPTPDTA